MRANIAAYDMWSPSSLEEALVALDSKPEDNTPFAGGTDLMVLLEAGVLPPGRFMNIWALDDLRGIEITDESITLGALTTYGEIRANEVLGEHYPMLGEAAKETGAVAIQNRGTLGGNIMNASPAADTPPALLVYDAEIEMASVSGSRWIPYSEFHLGYKSIKAESNELLKAIRIPRKHDGWISYYRKVGTRKAQAISKVCFASNTKMAGPVVEDIRIALASVAPIPLRCEQTEAVLRGNPLNAGLIDAAVSTFEKEITPIDDIRSMATYRMRVSVNLLRDMLGLLVS